MELLLVVTDFNLVYSYRDWDGWVKDLLFEHRMRHRMERADGVCSDYLFVRWHSVEVFVVPLRERILLYRLVPS